MTHRRFHPPAALVIGRALCCLLALAGSVARADTPAASSPNASIRPPCTDSGAACLERVAGLYLKALLAHDGSALPLAPNVRRTENALTNANGEHEVRESFARTHMVEAVRDPRFFVDPAKGEVVAFFRIDVDLKEADAKDTTTKAGSSEYKVAITVPKGTYTVHEAERFRIVAGQITEIEIIAHVEKGKGGGAGWPMARSK